MGRKQPTETNNRTSARSSARREKSKIASILSEESVKTKPPKDSNKCSKAKKDTNTVAERSIKRKTTAKIAAFSKTKCEQNLRDKISEPLPPETDNTKGKTTRSKRNKNKESENDNETAVKDASDKKPVKLKPSPAVNHTYLDNESDVVKHSGERKSRKRKKHEKEIKEETGVVHDTLKDVHGSLSSENVLDGSKEEGTGTEKVAVKHILKESEEGERKSLKTDIHALVKEEVKEHEKDASSRSEEEKLNIYNCTDVMSILMHMEGPSVSESDSHSKVMVQDDKMISDSDSDEPLDEDAVEDSGQSGMKDKNKSKRSIVKDKKQDIVVSRYFVDKEVNSGGITDDFLPDQPKRRKTLPKNAKGAASKKETGKQKLDLDKPQTLTKAVGSRKKKESYLAEDRGRASKKKNENGKNESKDKKGKSPVIEDCVNDNLNDKSSTAPRSATKSRKRKKDDIANNKDTIDHRAKLSENIVFDCISEGDVKRKKKTEKSDRKTLTDLPQESTDKKKAKKSEDETKTVVPRDHIPSHINKSDVMSILMHMEGPSTSKGQIDSNLMEDNEMSDTDSEERVDKKEEQTSDDSEDDWEDVEDHQGDSPKKSQTPSKSVEITLDAPVIYKKRKKKEFNLHDYLKKQVNKYKRELALDTHKVKFEVKECTWMYLNTVCKADTLRAQVMSVVMAAREIICSSAKFHSQDHVTNVLKWMNKAFQFVELKSSTKTDMEDRLTSCLENRTVSDSLEFTLVCVMVLRYLGFVVRLVMSLQPIPYKQAQKTGAQKSAKGQQGSKSKAKPTKTDTKEIKPVKSIKPKSEKSGLQMTSGSKSKKKKNSAIIPEDKSEHSSGKRNKRRCSKNLSKGTYKEIDNVDGDYDDDDDDDLDKDFRNVGEIDSGSESEEDVTVLKRKKKATKKSAKSSQISPDKDDQNLSSDSDFEENSILIRTKPLRREPSRNSNNRVLSSDSEGSPKQHSKQNVSGNDTWLEVYIKAENKWISVCSKSKEVSKPATIRSQATVPLYYVVGFDNDNTVKDVTIRYASEWLTKTRKLRVEDDWWTETLEPFCTKDKERDEAEDKEMQAYLLQCPMPTSVSQFKGHPLYILKRHLLKYEALYPNSIVPLGFIRGEPVYSRDCCHTLHSRENWLKEGRCVRLGEEPYKYVKSRKRWNDKDSEPKDCELFGKWQTEIYIPPPAVDGVIPRNAHGNVEMFQTWMLPGGTVHLKGLPALNRIARKLDIDCAPAMVGWDHHCGFAHPVMDGWIVCEEHKDILLAAWDEEQEIIQQRETEKREKRVYENWKKLIRGLLIKDRLKKRYDLEEKKEPSTSKEKSDGDKESGDDTTVEQQSWPRNRLTEFKSACSVLQK